MASVNPASLLQPTPKFSSNVHSVDDLTPDDFLQFMITQLQQQDPLNPVGNQELLDQISSIRNLSATTKLSSTLDSVLVGQNLTTASGLIGKNITAITEQGDPVEGKVSSVSVAVDATDKTKRDIQIHVGDQSVKLTNIREIVP